MFRAATRALFAALAASVLAPAVADGSDGVVELSQARALAGGVTPGDAPGFPVTLSRSGSYRLTSDLDLSSGGAAGIEIVAPALDVEVDLGGFTIHSVGQCSFGAGGVDCTFLGLPNGVTSSSAARITLRHGTIRGMRSGVVIVTADAVTLEDLTLTQHTNSGVFVTSGIPTTVRRVAASVIAGVGIDAGSLGRVHDSTAERIGGDGIQAAEVVESTSASNLGSGIEADFPGARVSASRAVGNGGTGILVGVGGVVSASAAHGNKVGAQLRIGASIVSSTLRGNQGSGLVTVSGSTYEGCTITGNQNGAEVQVSGTGTQLLTNFCGTDTTCP